MSDFKNIDALEGQSDFLSCVDECKDISYFFFIAGYGSGKSFCIILLLLTLCTKYQNYPLNIGLGGVTLGKIQKFILDDFFKICTIRKIPYIHDKQHNIIKIGRVTIFCIPVESPTLIYGYNLDLFLCDEIDELKIDVCLEAFKAIHERTRRKTLPDRIPFMCFFTTTQGKKRGCYLKRESLKEQGVKSVVVRAKTKDNPYNSESYFKGLSAIYSEEEKKAFLDGEDVDFTTGLVYPDYNDSHIVEPFEIRDDDVIYIGQDLNSGFSKGVAVVKRNKVLYIVRNWSFSAIGDAPAIIRNTYPNNDIYWFPDASSKEIMAGYAAEIRNANIHLRIANFNPSILERIFLLNKMFKCGKLKVFKGNDKVTQALSIRCFNDLGMPEKGKGENSPDHICDATEYVIYRLIMSDLDFADIKNIKRSA